MSFASLNGERITTAKISIPLYGAWSADVSLAAVVPITSPPATLVVGNLSLVGAVYRSGVYGGARKARLVAGAGGWRRSIPSQAYKKTAGIKKSIVLGDAASLVGESVTVADDTSIGSRFVREAAPASRVLAQLAGSIWWIDNTGRTRVGARPTGNITTAFDVIAWDPGRGSFQIATEFYADWVPGRSFTSVTVPGTQTISLTTLTIDNDGKARVDVLASGNTNA